MKTSTLAFLLLLIPSLSFASSENPIYVGGGVSNSKLDNDTLKGNSMQVFVGYDIADLVANVDTSAELGYMYYGQTCEKTLFEELCKSQSGLYINGLVSKNISGQVGVVARLGLDIGDDDGAMFGVGLRFDATEQLRFSLEKVKRPHVDALQLNLTYKLK